MAEIGNVFRDIEVPNVAELGNYTKNIRIARIIRVYDADYVKNTIGTEDKYGKVDIIFLDSPSTVPVQIPFLMPWFSWSRGAGIMCMPEQNDIVACLQRHNGYPIVIGFLPYKWDVSVNDAVRINDVEVGSTRQLNKGELLIKSSSGGNIVINTNGTVEISGVDGSVTENIISGISGNNEEPSFDRVQAGEFTGLAKTIVGKSYLIDGAAKFVGGSPQIFESGTSEFYEQTVELPHMEEVSFFMPSDSEIIGVKSVAICYTDDKSVRKSVNLTEDQYTLTTQNVYTPGAADNNDIYYKPATIERNSIKYTLKVPVYNLNNAKTTAVFSVKKFVGGIRVNTMGDLFLDGRNVIVRSANENATLSLSNSGVTRLRGSNQTMVGNADGGQVTCSYGGVQYSQGAALESISPEYTLSKQNLYSALGVEDSVIGALFYITDGLPLIKYFMHQDGKWDYDVVTVEEYSKFSAKSRATVNKITLSPFNYLLTKEKLAELMLKDAPTYADLKASGK